VHVGLPHNINQAPLHFLFERYECCNLLIGVNSDQIFGISQYTNQRTVLLLIKMHCIVLLSALSLSRPFAHVDTKNGHSPFEARQPVVIGHKILSPRQPWYRGSYCDTYSDTNTDTNTKLLLILNYALRIMHRPA
jgi:hypothetical protein